MIENPPTFSISPLCCKYTKKDIIHQFIKEESFDLNIYGVRKSEGGLRSTSYRSCFTHDPNDNCDEYRPIFWLKNEDKQLYNQYYKIQNSNCYSCYGLSRTGCAGCPMGRNFEYELKIYQKYEPQLYKAITNIFHESYEYLRAYHKFAAHKSELEKFRKRDLSFNGYHQLTFFELFS